MHGVDRPEHVGMAHAEADCPITAHENPRNPPGIPPRQSAELRIDPGYEFVDHEILPVAGHGRIHVPRTAQGSGHVRADQNKRADRAGGDSGVEKFPRIPMIENRAIVAIQWIRQKVDGRVSGRGLAVPGWKINRHIPNWTDGHAGFLEAFRLQLQRNHQAIRGRGQSGRGEAKRETGVQLHSVFSARAAVAARYQPGHRSSHSGAHIPRRAGVRVTRVRAAENAAQRLNSIRAARSPCRTPRISTGRNKNRLNPDSPSVRNVTRHNEQGRTVKNALVQSVRRDKEARATPPAHAPPLRRARRQKNGARSVLVKEAACSRAALTDTERPINKKLAGSARPSAASQGCQLVHCAASRRATRPRTSDSALQPLSPASVKSPSTASRSSGPSSLDTNPTIGGIPWFTTRSPLSESPRKALG